MGAHTHTPCGKPRNTKRGRKTSMKAKQARWQKHWSPKQIHCALKQKGGGGGTHYVISSQHRKPLKANRALGSWTSRQAIKGQYGGSTSRTRMPRSTRDVSKCLYSLRGPTPGVYVPGPGPPVLCRTPSQACSPPVGCTVQSTATAARGREGAVWFTGGGSQCTHTYGSAADDGTVRSSGKPAGNGGESGRMDQPENINSPPELIIRQRRVRSAGAQHPLHVGNTLRARQVLAISGLVGRSVCPPVSATTEKAGV